MVLPVMPSTTVVLAASVLRVYSWWAAAYS